MKEELAMLQPVLESKSLATAELLKKVGRQTKAGGLQGPGDS